MNGTCFASWLYTLRPEPALQSSGRLYDAFCQIERPEDMVNSLRCATHITYLNAHRWDKSLIELQIIIDRLKMVTMFEL
jgi:hypothetical protein